MHVKEEKSGVHSISSNLPTLILFGNCDDTWDSNSINLGKNLEKVDITSNSISDIFDPTNLTIDDSVEVVGDKANSKTNYNNWNIEFNGNPPDTYRCSASETILVYTSCENEFISIALGENVRPESLADDILWRTKPITFIFYWKIFVLNKKKSISHVKKIF